MLRIIQLLKGKKAAHFRHHMATLLEKYLDADMGLADDITDRALQAHMADLKAAKGSNAEDGGDNWRQCVACTQHICFCVSDMLYFDGLLGDRADPLMQAWVALDNQVKSRLFAHSTHGVPEEIKLLQDKYMSLRVILFDYVASLNDQILFQDREGPKG